jgi:hypothetical protein
VPTFLADICAEALAVARAGVPRRRWGGRSVLNMLGEVAGVWLRLTLTAPLVARAPGAGAIYALTKRQLGVTAAKHRVYTDHRLRPGRGPRGWHGRDSGNNAFRGV